jgi:MoaA/NifB/PqqE/SkfB family radical SAM enzyme
MTVAASKGGVFKIVNCTVGKEIPLVKKWIELGNKTTNAKEVYSYLKSIAQPVHLEMGISNDCDLNCSHCFLGYPKGKSIQNNILDLDELIFVAEKFVSELSTKTITITDREPLNSKKLIPLLYHLKKLRSNFQDFRFGLVTNGLRIREHADKLSDIKPDYLDISLDGVKEEHDRIRGSGNFTRVLKNIRIAVEKEISEKITIASTLMNFNGESIIKMICDMIENEGVQYFDITPILTLKNTEKLHENQIINFFERINKEIEKLKPSKETFIYFELCAYCASYFPAVFGSGWLKPNEIQIDSTGRLFSEININDKITFLLRPELIPDYFWNSLRISADGYIIGGCEPLLTKNYKSYSIGNIREIFNEKGLNTVYRDILKEGSVFHQMILAYEKKNECMDRKCFKYCLGGDSLLSKVITNDFYRRDPGCIKQTFFKEVYNETS